MDKIVFQDQIAEFNNRVQLVPVAGQENTYDVVQVPGEVTQEGTLLRALELNQMQDNTEQALDNVERLTEKPFIVAHLGSSYTAPTTGAELLLPFDTASYKRGSGLILSQNKIIVGSGVQYAKVHVKIYITSDIAVGTRRQMFIKRIRNGTSVGIENDYFTYTGQYTHRSVQSRVFPVQEGDEIAIYYLGTAGDILTNYQSGTRVMVEAV